jgi:membrane associated rhomboid family serine protease
MTDTPERKHVERHRLFGPLSRPAATLALVFGLPAGLAVALLDRPAKLWAALIIGTIGGLMCAFMLLRRRWPD